MKIKHITINKNDINKDNINNCNYSYSSIVNNNTESTSGELINTAAVVLFDIFKHLKGENNDEENA